MTKEELIELKESLLNNEIVLDEQRFYPTEETDYTYKYKERKWHITEDSIDIYPEVLGNKIFVESIEDIIEYTVRNLIDNNITFDTIRLKLYQKYHNPSFSINTQKKLYPFNNIVHDSNLSWDKRPSYIKTNINLTIYNHKKINDNSEAIVFLYDERLEISNPQISYKFNIILPLSKEDLYCDFDNHDIDKYIDFFKIMDLLENLGYRVSYSKNKIIVTVDFTKNRIRKLHI